MQDLLERVVGLGAPAQRLGEGRRADRHDHELLEVDVVVGVRAAVEDVHHRHGQHVGVDAADVAVERAGRARRRRPWPRPATRRGWRWRPGGPCCRCRRASSSMPVDVALVERVEADERVGDLVVDVVDGVEHALAAVAGRRRRGARPPRTRRSTRPTARRPGPWRPTSSTTSTSTVGLPRESRISRPTMSSMMLTMLDAPRRGGGKGSQPRTGDGWTPPHRRPPPPPHPVSASGTRAQRARTGGRTAQAGCWCSSTVLPAGSWRNACRLFPTGPGSLTVTPEARSSATVAARSSTRTAKC